jgi:hypothetical protein
MSKKKKIQDDINELKANNKWEQVHRERDRLKTDRIKNLGMRSKLDVLIGGLIFFASYYGFIDLAKIMSANVKEPGAFSFHKMIKGIAPNEFAWVAVLAALGLLFFFFAMSKNETIDKLTAARYVWMPDSSEAEFIEKRFDNDFVRSILSVLSSDDTHSIETGLEAVTVNNNTGSEEFNYNKCGFSRLTNYDTKQLSYYLASHSFPEGFAIYQTKITAAGSEKYLGGITDIGGDQPPAEDEEKHNMKMLARVYEQLREFVEIKNPFKMYLKELAPSPSDNGQIVLNKGFKADKEGYAEL